jgi:PIN domain nuclease of toxin-antitoxin system
MCLSGNTLPDKPKNEVYISSFQLPYKSDHKDPFDRMLIHLAIKNNYTLVTCDSKAALYETDGLKHFW